MWSWGSDISLTQKWARWRCWGNGLAGPCMNQDPLLILVVEFTIPYVLTTSCLRACIPSPGLSEPGSPTGYLTAFPNMVQEETVDGVQLGDLQGKPCCGFHRRSSLCFSARASGSNLMSSPLLDRARKHESRCLGPENLTKVDAGCPQRGAKQGLWKALLIIPLEPSITRLLSPFPFTWTSAVFSLLSGLEPSKGYAGV